mmetsp:Transcript_15490/g.21378  ORF Transcript_15490/g.21378 Transcript_15490/m.21378 type:complete len:127 (-) Transcript_15490:91-471(-)|eukprot:CAMPEP_0196587264 /NCGR_PEP_ID=MMETSP1081-20130531/56968_1 /TAXON_ID=36882 /ORGANISM="Pyramimonas amylifera, Strain CCMP720" /LENGTH=126 /DNA_ID=CAMNT_0041909403 /DNA_START=103 /DNA_END=483 /DNA_ORIENTATION=-
MARSQAIFEWMFSLAQQAGVIGRPLTQDLFQQQRADGKTEEPGSYRLSYVSVDDEGIDKEAIEARYDREAQSLKNLQVTVSNVTTFPALHEWFYSEHRCYSVERQNEMMYPQEETYGLDAKALRSY